MLDLDTLIVEVDNLLPKDEPSRNALSIQASVITFIKQTLEELLINFKPQHDSKELQLAILIVRLTAELAKAEHFRDRFAETGSIPLLLKLLAISCGPLLKSSESHYMDNLTIHTLRSCANLCFDHEGNRDAIAANPECFRYFVLPLSSKNTDVVKTAAGTVVNISMDNEPVQTGLANANAINVILGLCQKWSQSDPNSESACLSAVKCLSNLVESETGLKLLLDMRGLGILLEQFHSVHYHLIKADNPQDYFRDLAYVDSMILIFETIFENNDIQRQTVSLGKFEYLLDFVDQAPCFVPTQNDIDEEEPNTSYAECRKNICKNITCVTMNDDNMKELVKQSKIINRFKQWMTTGISTSNQKEEEEVRMTAALCIGNLARSDSSCELLVGQHNVAQALASLLKLEYDRLRNAKDESTRSNIKVLHAVIGCLKNLSLSVHDRPLLGSIGIIDRIVALFEIDHIKPLQYGGIGVLRNLTNGIELNVYRVITGFEPPINVSSLSQMTVSSANPTSPLGKLVSLVWKAVNDNDMSIRNEGGRVISNVVKTCHQSRAHFFIPILLDLNCVPLLVQIVTGALLTKSTTNGPHDKAAEEDVHVHFNATPSAQVYPIVQNEGLIALALLCLGSTQASSKIGRYHASLIPALKQILESIFEADTKKEEATQELSENPVYTNHIRANAAQLIKVLTASDMTFREKAAAELKESLLKVIDYLDQGMDASHANKSKNKEPASKLINPSDEPAIRRKLTKSATKTLTDGLPSRQDLTKQFANLDAEPMDLNMSLREILTETLEFMP